METYWLIWIVLTIVVLIALAFKFLQASASNNDARGGGTGSTGILFVGPPGGGKTAAFHALFDRPSMRTQLSVKSNKQSFGKTTVTDVPGSLPPSDSVLSRATAVVVFVDSTGFNEPAYADNVARSLVPVLSNASLRERRVPVMIAVTKRDIGFLTIPIHRVVDRVESALSVLATAAIAAADVGSAASDARLAALSDDNGKVKLDAVGVPVTVEAVTAAGEKQDVQALKDFVSGVSA